MVDLKLEVNGLNEAIRRITHAGKALPTEMRRAIKRSGFLVERRMKKNLSGPSHSRFPGNGNPYPGVVSNALRGGVNTQIGASGLEARVGPGGNAKRYAAIQEFGGTITVTPRMRSFLAWKKGIFLKKSTTVIRIPARPYVLPTLVQSKSEIINEFQEAVRRSLR